jgi:demethylmenaquinone methyltransferase/2-methoxy-6-polyprenyl-1,4-benzoquinol methylase
MAEGLGRNAKHVYSAYRKMVKSYEKTNQLMTFFRVTAWRKFVTHKIAENLVKDRIKLPRILDAGAGPGFMADLLNKEIGSDVILMDYSIEMLENSVIDCDKVQGLFEAMPFRDNIFDAVIAGFAFHASIDMNKSASEFARVSRSYVGIVSIGKSNNKLYMKLGKLYIDHMIPLIARLSAGKNYVEFKKIRKIYMHIPDNARLSSIFRKYYNIDIFKEIAFGTIYQIIARKKIK